MKTDITMARRVPLDRKLLSPRLSIFLDVAVTLGVMLDWLPSYLGVNNSGTKLIVVPLILFDLLRSNQKYVLNPFMWFYTLTFLVGIGGSWLLGNTTEARLISLLPTVLVLMFYMRSRSPQDHLRILKIMFYASLLVPISIVLSWREILQPKEVVETAEFTRVLAAVSWSSLGLFTSIPPALFGGIFLTLDTQIKRSWQNWLLAIASLLIGFTGVMLAGQRSAGLAFFLALALAGISLFVRVPARQKVRLLFVYVLIIVFFSNAFLLQSKDLTGSFMIRMGQLETRGDDLRTWMLDQFMHDISTQPHLIGQGSSVRYADLGIITMHMIFAEAYYNGGLLFMMMLVLSFVWAGWNLVIRLLHRQYRCIYFLTSALVAMLAGSSIQLLTHPGLNIRLVYLLLGLCIAHVNIEKADGDYSPTMGRERLNDRGYRI